METLLKTMVLVVGEYVYYTSWWILLGQVVAVIVAYTGIRGLFSFLIIRITKRHREPLSFIRNGKNKILLVGDSTAVGTGAKKQEQTMAGFLSHDFPHTDVINKAVNGSLTCAVLKQLAQVEDKVFDMIIISTGGNDVWAMTRKSKICSDIRAVLRKANSISNQHVILLFFGNEGSAPFFPFFLRPLLLYRTEMVRKIFIDVASTEKIPFIELFSNPEENPFVKNPQVFFAPDGLHPNEFGYWEWYKHLWRLMVRKEYLFHEEKNVATLLSTVDGFPSESERCLPYYK